MSRKTTYLILASILWTGVSLSSQVALSAAWQCQEAFDNSVSAQLSWLEKDTPERTEWIRAQNHEVNAQHKAGENSSIVGPWLRKVFSQPKKLQVKNLSDGRILSLVFQGLGKGTELILQEPDQPARVLFSNRKISANLNSNLLNFAVSPNGRRVVLTYAKKGSLDDFSHLIYDLKLEKVEGKEFSSTTQTPVWASNESLYLQQWQSATNSIDLLKRNLKGKTKKLGAGEIGGSGDAGSVLAVENRPFYLSPEGKTYFITDVFPENIIGRSGQDLYFLTKSQDGFGEIRKVTLPLEAGEAPASQVILAEGTRQISGVRLTDVGLIYHSDILNDRRLVMADLSGKTLAEIQLPDFAIGEISRWVVKDQKVSISMSSDVVKNRSFTYDLTTGSFDRQTFREELMTVDGVEMVSELTQVIGDNGVAVPTRLIHRKDFVKDGKAPAFIEVYGGFGLSGYFTPRFNEINRAFVMNGGVLVHPAVRGSNELGPNWHHVASMHHKERTFEDVINVAKTLDSQKYSSARRIVLTGTSNGGMVTAASALKGPEAFGLVIPISGVEDMLGKEYLDRRMGEGWSYEYGDSRKPEDLDYLKTYAPVEKAPSQQADPEFLIVDGINDSRVNSAHSLKLQAAMKLRGNPASQSQLMSLKNAGHWLAKIDYQDQIAWRANTVIWSRIYDFLGMKFKPVTADSERAFAPGDL